MTQGITAAEPPPVVTRDLPAGDLQPDDTFGVIITFSASEDDFNAVGVTDVAPAGWDVIVTTALCNPAPFAGYIPTPGTIQYAWFSNFPAGTEFTVVYQVTVPAEATAGSYVFPDGFIEYFLIGVPQDHVPITGDTTVTVGGVDIPPTVDATDPDDGATGVPVDTAIEVTFSEAMDTASAEGAFSIDPAATGSFGWDAGDTVMTFTPDADLAGGRL